MLALLPVAVLGLLEYTAGRLVSRRSYGTPLERSLVAVGGGQIDFAAAMPMLLRLRLPDRPGFGVVDYYSGC